MDDYTLWQIEQIIDGLVSASAVFATLGILMYVALCIAVAACAHMKGRHWMKWFFASLV